MRIEINQDWIIDFDGVSYMPTKKQIVTAKDSKRQGEVNERVYGYFKDLSLAVEKIVKTDLGDSDEAISLKEYVSQYKAASQSIISIINQ